MNVPMAHCDRLAICGSPLHIAVKAGNLDLGMRK